MIKRNVITYVVIIFLTSCSDSNEIFIRINPEQTGEQISEYIYGQFIEHLGRCIYGGIWAEMLEDRKFYYPVTDIYDPWSTDTDPYWNTGEYKYLNASPWKITGPQGTVTMDTLHAFTGRHSPVIHLPGDGTYAGISQDSLALIEGRTYIGRIILAGDQETLPVTVRLVDENEQILSQDINIISSEYQTFPLRFSASSSGNKVKIEIISKGKGEFTIGTISLMPEDNLKGWRKDVVELLKELNSPVYRWPGGNFVSGYNWRDGIGERDKRPPRKNPAWKGVEPNDVGIHEYMDLMEMIDAEPFVSVNTGLGTIQEVEEEVEYCNGSDDTPMGRLRAMNGHPEPYRVKWWAVGNEMYGEWQLGHIPLEEYVQKHNLVAEAMERIDPNIRLIGVGSVGEWSETMLKICSDHMNLISEHIYCKEIPDIIQHTAQLAEQIKYKADAHRKYREDIPGLKEKDIRIAMDEWNYWYGDYIYGELGVQYHLKDALGVARGLHEYFRNSDLYFMANYAQTVNVIGCIKTTRTEACFATTALPLILYRNHFGTIPVEVTGETGDLDISAALTKDKKALTVAVINPTDKAGKLVINLGDIIVKEKIAKWTIHHNNPEIFNEPGKKPNVFIQEENSKCRKNTIESPSLSVVLYNLEMK